MAIVSSMILAILAQGAAPATEFSQETYDVGFEELVANDNSEAREVIENSDTLAQDDPARLINRGIALARMGNYESARADFELAANARDSVELETADGNWVDSRRLARKALAMLEKGDFARYYALSLR